jgi:hypothetical protein
MLNIQIMGLIFKLEINQNAGTEPQQYGFIDILVRITA